MKKLVKFTKNCVPLLCIFLASSNIVNADSRNGLFLCVADDEDQCSCLVQNDGSGLMWYKGSLPNSREGVLFANKESVLNMFNTEKHCGYSDWRIPMIGNIKGSLNSYYFGDLQIRDNSEFGQLGRYAIKNGYIPHTSLANWLNKNGFAVISGRYWSSLTSENMGAWVLDMNVGMSYKMYQKNNANLLLVRDVSTNM